MLNALTSALSGMRSNQSALDVTADNIANSNTPGFKKSIASFSTALQQTSYYGSGSSANLGGTNPVQVGLGASVSAISRDMTQGSLEATGNALDLAVQGDGFFAVSDGIQTYYTRLGTFDIDSSGYVVLDGTGYRLTGNTYSMQLNSSGDQTINKTGTAIQIPTGSTLAPQRTTSITMQGNLDASTATLTGTSLQSILPLVTGSDGQAATESTMLSDLSIFNGTAGSAGDTLTLYLLGTQPDGTTFSTSVDIHPWDDPGTGTGTVGELVDALNAALVDGSGTRFGKVTLDDGLLVASAVTTGDSFSLFVNEQDPATFAGGTVPDDFLDSASGFDVNAWMYADASNSNFMWYRTRMSPEVVSSSIQIYDGQGGEHTVQVRYYPTGSQVDSLTGEIMTMWDMIVSANPDEGTVVDDLVSGIVFDSDGRFTGDVGTSAAGTVLTDSGFVGDPSSAQIRIDWVSTGPSDPPTVDIDLGKALSLEGLTGFGASSTASASEQDGYAASSLDSISVSTTGDILGLYTNGKTVKIAQIALSVFANPAGLVATGGTMYQAGANSGLAVSRTAGEGAGMISTGVLESSNVDIASEFARLIVAQSGYQASAKVIQTSQEMLDTAIGLIR
jgi:flagellar hook protein FlgE